MELILEKYHGLGNDYLVYDPNKNAAQGGGSGDIIISGCAAGAGGDNRVNAAAVRLICDRNYGIGGDGILYGPIAPDGGRIGAGGNPGDAAGGGTGTGSGFGGDASFGVRIFNPDGGEAEKSGNGVRIFARYLKDSGYMGERRFTLSTRGGDVEVEYLTDDGSVMKVMMGRPTFKSHEIPVLIGGPDREAVGEPMYFGGVQYLTTCVSLGNPHCVIPMDGISKDIALTLGPLVESAPYFPNRTNVQFLKVIDRHNIQIEIYERGAGYTLASGSSSCAAASAAYRLGLTDAGVTVHMPGGRLEINVARDGRVYMTGAVSRVGTFTASGEFMRALRGK